MWCIGGCDYEDEKDENTNTAVDNDTMIEKHKYKRHKCSFAAPLLIGFCDMQCTHGLPVDGGDNDNEEYK